MRSLKYTASIILGVSLKLAADIFILTTKIKCYPVQREVFKLDTRLIVIQMSVKPPCSLQLHLCLHAS